MAVVPLWCRDPGRNRSIHDITAADLGKSLTAQGDRAPGPATPPREGIPGILIGPGTLAAPDPAHQRHEEGWLHS